jgi:hypothetical protein
VSLGSASGNLLTLQMKELQSFKTSGTTEPAKQRHIAEDQNP